MVADGANSDAEISMRGLAELFADLVPGARYTTIEYPSTYPAGEPQRRCPDLTKARTELGYKPEETMHDGLVRMMKWYQLLREREQKTEPRV